METRKGVSVISDYKHILNVLATRSNTQCMQRKYNKNTTIWLTFIVLFQSEIDK